MVRQGIHGILIVVHILVQPQRVCQNADFLPVVPVYLLPDGADSCAKLLQAVDPQHLHHLLPGFSPGKLGGDCQGNVGIDRRPHPVGGVHTGKDFPGTVCGEGGHRSHGSLHQGIPLPGILIPLPEGIGTGPGSLRFPGVGGDTHCLGADNQGNPWGIQHQHQGKHRRHRHNPIVFSFFPLCRSGHILLVHIAQSLCKFLIHPHTPP